MEIGDKIKLLYDKDSTVTYTNLLELEEISEYENTLYSYLNEFVSMLKSEKYSIRVRGFRLLCKQAKWDVDDKINEVITEILFVVNDEKPTAVRQALQYLRYIVLNKKELIGIIKEAVLSIDCSRFKDTMRPVIEKDIQALIKVMDKQFFIDFLNDYNECWYKKDLRKVKKLYADELIYFDNHKGNDTYTLDEHIGLLEDFFVNGKSTEAGEVEPLIIEGLNVFHTENSACLCYLARYKSCPAPAMRCTMFLEAKGEKWKINHVHCSFQP